MQVSDSWKWRPISPATTWKNTSVWTDTDVIVSHGLHSDRSKAVAPKLPLLVSSNYIYLLTCLNYEDCGPELNSASSSCVAVLMNMEYEVVLIKHGAKNVGKNCHFDTRFVGFLVLLARKCYTGVKDNIHETHFDQFDREEGKKKKDTETKNKKRSSKFTFWTFPHCVYFDSHVNRKIRPIITRKITPLQA